MLLAGIIDTDIRGDALGAKDIQRSPLNDVIGFVEGREMARNVTPQASFSAMYSLKRNQTSLVKRQIKSKMTGQSFSLAQNVASVSACSQKREEYGIRNRIKRAWSAGARNGVGYQIVKGKQLSCKTLSSF